MTTIRVSERPDDKYGTFVYVRKTQDGVELEWGDIMGGNSSSDEELLAMIKHGLERLDEMFEVHEEPHSQQR